MGSRIGDRATVELARALLVGAGAGLTVRRADQTLTRNGWDHPSVGPDIWIPSVA
jgi:hypothetical protein